MENTIPQGMSHLFLAGIGEKILACRPVARIDFGVVWNPLKANLLDPKSGLYLNLTLKGTNCLKKDI